MKRHFRKTPGFPGALLSIVLFTATFAPAAGKAPASGKKLFEAKCSQCHDKDAKGNARMARVLKVDPSLMNLAQGPASKLTTEELEGIVTRGKQKMPMFKRTLTPGQVQSVVEYMKSLQRAAHSGK